MRIIAFVYRHGQEECIIKEIVENTFSGDFKPFKISCAKAEELIAKSRGDIKNLNMPDGALLVHHTKRCEKCRNKWQKAKNKTTRA